MIVSAVVRERRARPALPHLGWIAKQELACHSVRSSAETCEEFSCLIAWTHAKICQEYRFIMIPRKTEVRPAACRAARYSGKHQVNQPFIMYAGSWRAGINFIFMAPYFANEKKKKKEGTGQLHNSGGLGWCHSLIHSLMSLAKMNDISFNWSHRAHCYLTCTHRHPAFLTVNMCWTVRWDTVARLYDIHSQADILVQQHILKCSPSAGSQLWMPTLNNTTCHASV